MIFMILFWATLALVGALFVIDHTQKKERFEDAIGLLVVIQLILFFLAIATDDPVLPSSWGVDPWWELTLEGALAGFAIWKAYLNPMKKKVYDLDREIGEIKATVTVQYTEINKRIDTLSVDMEKRFDAIDRKHDKLLDLIEKRGIPH